MIFAENNAYRRHPRLRDLEALVPNGRVVGNRTLPVNLSDTSFARFWLTGTPFDYRNTDRD